MLAEDLLEPQCLGWFRERGERAHVLSHRPMMSILRHCLALLGLAVASVAALAAEPSEGERVNFEFALYFAPTPKTDPEQALAQLLDQEFKSLRDHLTVHYKWSSIDDYAPPTPESFRYAAVGLEPADGAAMAKSERVFVLGFEATRASLLRANREANILTHRLAELTDGLPWDEECRLVYSRAAWHEKRVATWQGDIPDVRDHVTMHAYRNPDLVRIITLGMRKFGLPDLVIAQTASGKSRPAGNTINACAQRLIEGQQPEAERFELVLKEVRHEKVREYVLTNPLKGATGRVLLRLSGTPREDGDPQNRLLALEFPEAEGHTPLEKQATALAALYGAEDEIVHHRSGDAAMKAASDKARRDFLAKLPRFRQGLAPNERVIVKAPFVIGDQTEYMWVEVTGWQATKLEGVLMNDSYLDEKLRVGRRLTVPFSDVFDYIHYKPDGTEEGNETVKILKPTS